MRQSFVRSSGTAISHVKWRRRSRGNVTRVITATCATQRAAHFWRAPSGPPGFSLHFQLNVPHSATGAPDLSSSHSAASPSQVTRPQKATKLPLSTHKTATVIRLVSVCLFGLHRCTIFVQTMEICPSNRVITASRLVSVPMPSLLISRRFSVGARSTAAPAACTYLD